MKKINKLDFSVTKKTNKKSQFAVVPVVLLLILVGIISLFFILTKNNFNIKKVLGLREIESTTSETTTEEETETVADTDFTDSVNFLAICHDDDNNVSFAFILSLLPEESRLRIKPIDPDMNIEVFTGEMTFNDAYQNVSIDKLVEGLNNKNIPVNRYVLFSETNFISVIQTLGTVSIDLDADFEYYSNQIKYICSAGHCEFTSDALLAFMKYHGDGDSKLEFSSLGAKTIIETFFTEENVSKGETLFTTLINFVTTNITAFDYISAEPFINSLCKKGFTVTINL